MHSKEVQWEKGGGGGEGRNKIQKKTTFVEERTNNSISFHVKFFIFTDIIRRYLFYTMCYTTMYYILYNTINVKYLKTCSGLQDQRSAGTDYNLIYSVLLLYSSLVLIVGFSS